MHNDSKREIRVVESVTEGIAETSSIYAKGYSDSSMSSLSVVRSGEYQKLSDRLVYNDSNRVGEVYHIRASHDKPIDIGFDIRNAKVTKKGNNLEFFLPDNKQVIIGDYFRNLESLPNIVFAGTIILTGEEFLCVFAHTLYTWYREIRNRAGKNIRHTMSDIVKTVKNIRKKMSYQSITNDINKSKFWNSLRVVEEESVPQLSLSIHADIEKIENEISSIQNSLHTMSEHYAKSTMELKDKIEQNQEYISSVVTKLQDKASYAIGSDIHDEITLLQNSLKQVENIIEGLQTQYSHMLTSQQEVEMI